MTAATLHIGDVFDVMATMPDGTIDLVLTSPPFLALRSYLPADHPDKGKEIGSEPTPAAFLDTMLALTAEWGRLLTPTGSIAIELGDTYAGSGGGGGDYLPGGIREGQQQFAGSRAKNIDRDAWPLDKSLAMIPQLYAASLAYGRNLLTGADSPAGRWRVRNYICWARPNPPVGALGDKWRPATSYVTVATRSRTRYFDLDAMRSGSQSAPGGSTGRRKTPGEDRPSYANTGSHPAGAPPLDWVDDREATWEPLIGMPTAPYPGAHYATFPSELPRRLIECMAPAEVCTTCNEPRRRIVEATYVKTQATNNPTDRGAVEGVNGAGSDPTFVHGRAVKHVDTLGWTDCGCGTGWRPGVILDPFAGSGTTLAVAHGHARTAIGIDLNDDNEHLIRDRVGGLFLTVVNHKTGAAA